MPTDEDDDRLCRYCFEGEEAGELLTPCKCSGDQKYVHLACLRRWQRTVLVSQPTHPAFYERDPRHYKCNVCMSEFTCVPPSRLELMASFTGPELGALIDSGCVIAAHEEFTAMLQRELDEMPEFMRGRSSYEHWRGGAYLITEVAPLDPTLSIDVNSAPMLSALRSRLGDDLTIGGGGAGSGGQGLRLVPGGALDHVATDDHAALQRALAALQHNESEGMKLTFARDPAPGVGDDHVTAINLTRPIAAPSGEQRAEEARQRNAAIGKYAGCADVEVVHYVGGPCGDEDIAACVVTGGAHCGWTIINTLSDAIELAHQRSYKHYEAQGEVRGGQSVRLAGLQARPDLNGEVGIALRFVEGSGRWLVRLKGGEGKQLKPANLAPVGPSHGVVHCVWGDAQWSRTQLLGEIARGHWGLCRASVAELVAPPAERRAALDGRLVFAPQTEMTDETIRNAQRQMEREAAMNARAGNLHQQQQQEDADDTGARAERLSGAPEGADEHAGAS